MLAVREFKSDTDIGPISPIFLSSEAVNVGISNIGTVIENVYLCQKYVMDRHVTAYVVNRDAIDRVDQCGTAQFLKCNVAKDVFVTCQNKVVSL
jgi:hypothetical protein